jgi:hypothetical protein
MNVHEGAKRMKQAGALLALIPVCFFVLILGLQIAISARKGTAGLGGVGFGVADILVLLAPGALLWLAGWITEGFAKNPD